jgi:hypothetical protein
MGLTISNQRPSLLDRTIQAEVGAMRLLEEGVRIDIEIAQDASQELKKLYDEFLKNKEQLLEAARQEQKRSLGSRILNFLQAIGSISIGAAATAAGAAAAGAVLIINGVISLVNESAKAAGLYDQLAERLAHGDEQRREEIRVRIEFGTTCVTLGITVITSGVAGLANVGQGLRNAIQATKDVTAAAQGLSTIAQGRATSRRMHHEGQAFHFSTEIRLGEQAQAEFRAQTAALLASMDGMAQSTSSHMQGFQRLSQALSRV